MPLESAETLYLSYFLSPRRSMTFSALSLGSSRPLRAAMYSRFSLTVRAR
ncbi:MAG: hypothetical protein CISAcid_07950 [uncultured Acidilobus sp. CIS]|nr:MAG: hypothetical protein CISAcid_07950 [uncultured Acidilobus sp. CIS]